MNINIIAVGTKMPDWVNRGFQEYEKRITNPVKVNLIEIPATKRTKSISISKAMQLEGESIRKSLKPDYKTIALCIEGAPLDSMKLAVKLNHYQETGCDLSILIGGPDGLSDECLKLAQEQWSLSRLTLPHPLVRIVLIEAIYRACAINNKHPYHK